MSRYRNLQEFPNPRNTYQTQSSNHKTHHAPAKHTRTQRHKIRVKTPCTHKCSRLIINPLLKTADCWRRTCSAESRLGRKMPTRFPGGFIRGYLKKLLTKRVAPDSYSPDRSPFPDGASATSRTARVFCAKRRKERIILIFPEPQPVPVASESVYSSIHGYRERGGVHSSAGIARAIYRDAYANSGGL